MDWGQGWAGKGQFLLIKQAADDGDHGIEADNNEDNNDALPRAKLVLSNLTAIGSPVTLSGALLRRGTGANIWSFIFTGFGSACLTIDGERTFVNAGAPDNLTGELVAVSTFVNCTTNFADGDGTTFAVADWFKAQPGNQEADPQLSGFLPAAGSPTRTSGVPVSGDSFFDSVDYSVAFKDNDWTTEWTTAF